MKDLGQELGCVTVPDDADFRWLIGDEASRYLESVPGERHSLVAIASRLRRELSAVRTHLVLEQVELRERARAKFSRADRMFFTRRLLEQATDERLASHKASRSPPQQRVLDLCCGMGGDLIGWATHHDCLGMDRDAGAALLAAANCRAYDLSSAAVSSGDAATADLASYDGWHLDPDRRPAGHRTSQLAFSEPGEPAIEEMLGRQPTAAIKLAPSADVPPSWLSRCEREWLGSRRECRQQVLWFGGWTNQVGRHRATVVGRDAQCDSLAGAPGQVVPTTGRLGRFLIDPPAAVLAAGLVGSLCAEQQAAAWRWHLGYLTADQAADRLLAATFAVEEELPWDLRRVRAALRQRDVGRLEVKVRGVDIDPPQLIRQLKLRGSDQRVLLVSGPATAVRVVLATRVDSAG